MRFTEEGQRDTVRLTVAGSQEIRSEVHCGRSQE